MQIQKKVTAILGDAEIRQILAAAVNAQAGGNVKTTEVKIDYSGDRRRGLRFTAHVEIMETENAK